MSDFRDVTNIWMRDWRSLVQSDGYAVSGGNRALFFNTQRNSRGAFHDEAKYKVRDSHRLGFGKNTARTAAAFRIIIVLGARFVQIELGCTTFWSYLEVARIFEITKNGMDIRHQRHVTTCRRSTDVSDDDYIVPILRDASIDFSRKTARTWENLRNVSLHKFRASTRYPEIRTPLAWQAILVLEVRATANASNTSVSQSAVTLKQIVQHAHRQLVWCRGLCDIRSRPLRTCKHQLVST